MRLFTEPFKIWLDLTINPLTGLYVAKDVFKASAFYVGLIICILNVYLNYKIGVVSNDTALILLGYAMGGTGLKMVDNYLTRKTADSTGAPLIQEGTAVAPAAPVVVAPTVASKGDDQEAAAAEAI